MKENILEFYVNKFCFLDGLENVDITFIPPILRRKTSPLDKIALSTMNKAYSDDIQYVVFSSQFGEVERLLKIIEQYSLNKEVSPNIFSASVHNYPVGFFLFNIKKPLPYTALSALSSSISSGLISSIVSEYNNTLFCYADVNDNKITSFTVNLSKSESKNSTKFRLTLENNDNIKDDFFAFVELFKGNKDEIITPMFKIERIS